MVELCDLEFGLHAASSGFTLNCHEVTGVQTGLMTLRRETSSDLYFWGKIFGVKADYYIAFGLKDSKFEFPSKSFFCAGGNFQFRALESVTEEVAGRVIELNLLKPFTGILSTVLDAQEEGVLDADTNADVPLLTESHRLAQVVQEIDFDTAVVPKGAHALNEAHVVVPSSSFRGLATADATSINHYVHFRPPASIARLRALAQSDAVFYNNFLDSLQDDVPNGCWAVREDACMVKLRSLSWPGFTAFHVPGTTRFGGLYFGYGQKNRDLAFIL